MLFSHSFEQISTQLRTTFLGVLKLFSRARFASVLWVVRNKRKSEARPKKVKLFIRKAIFPKCRVGKFSLHRYAFRLLSPLFASRLLYIYIYIKNVHACIVFLFFTFCFLGNFSREAVRRRGANILL